MPAPNTLADGLAALAQSLGVDHKALVAEINALEMADDPAAPQLLIDDFYAGSGESGEGGSLNWTFTNGTISNVNNEVGHPGIILLRTGTTANQVSSFYLGSNASSTIIRMDEWQRMCWVFAPVTNSNDCAYQVGLLSAFGALAPTHGLYLERLSTDANWQFVARRANVQTRENSGVAFGTPWVNFKMRRISAAQIAFRLNNGAEVILDTNLPASADSFNIGFQRTPTTTNARDVKLDFFSMAAVGMAR